MCGGQGGRTIFGAQGALNISIYCDDAAWTGHLELEGCIMRYCVKAGESFTSQELTFHTLKMPDPKGIISLQGNTS